ncbi:hypothetical protein BJX99DRAFT_241917 [Aspergillus californicus]
MSITISQATIHDAPAIASILIDTYAEDAFVPYLLLPEASYQERLDFWTRFVLTGFNHDHHVFYKAVDESTGKIVAFSRLVYPPPTPLGDSYDSNEDITSPVANTPFMEKFFGVLEDHQTRFVDSTTVQSASLPTLEPPFHLALHKSILYNISNAPSLHPRNPKSIPRPRPRNPAYEACFGQGG